MPGKVRSTSAAGVAGIVLLGLAASACSREVPPLPRLAPDAVILAFGDSITRGVGAGEGDSYPEVLERLTGRTVINAGVSGEVSAAGRARFAAVLAEHRPDLVVLCHGGNDFLRKLGAVELADNLRGMLRLARAEDVPVVLIGVPEPGLRLRTAGLYADLAGEFGLPHEEEVLAEILSRGPLKADTIHPNREGYRRLAEAIHALLEDAGAL